MDFLSLEGLTQAYLVKISMTHNKHLTPRFKKYNEPISTNSAVQILSLNLAYVIIGIALHLHSLLVLFSCQKDYTPYSLILFDIHHI